MFIVISDNLLILITIHTRYSSVLGMSNIDLAPLDTTATELFPNSVRSAEMSNVISPCRCTPPIPAQKLYFKITLKEKRRGLQYNFSFLSSTQLDEFLYQLKTCWFISKLTS